MVKKLLPVVSSLGLYLTLAGNVLAQSATSSGSKGGTNSSLPNAGSTELTYILFLGGLVLFVFGTLKVVLSLRD